MKKHTLIAGIAVNALIAALSGTAVAQTAPDVLNSQIELGDVFSNMDVVIEGDHTGNVGSTSLATGNAASGFGDGSTDRVVESDQTMNGDATAQANMIGGRVYGTASTDATAYGNSTTGAQYQGARLEQTTGSNQISATATVRDTTADVMIASSTAAANIHDLTYTMGTLNANAEQTSNSNVDATTDAEVCCSSETTDASSLAVSNSYQASSTYSNAYSYVQQWSEGANVNAATRLTQTNGTDVSANSQAMGNNVVSDNTWGYSQLDGSQNNISAINSTTEVTLTDWSGTASISAYGVGNSTMQTNVGSDLNAYYTQTNSGSVDSTATFDGGNGGIGGLTSSSTAIGNTYTGYVCATCESAAPGGQLTQTNSGGVTARGSIIARNGGNVYGSAAAIGNSANYSTNNNAD